MLFYTVLIKISVLHDFALHLNRYLYNDVKILSVTQMVDEIYIRMYFMTFAVICYYTA